MVNYCNYIRVKRVNNLLNYIVVDEIRIDLEIGHFINEKELINFDLSMVVIFVQNFITKRKKVYYLADVKNVRVEVIRH